MSNIFGIFNTAVSGLYASQLGIEVTGHNIANMNTEGYSRQRINLNTATPRTVSPGQIGMGVNVQSITRIYDDILGQNLRDENTSLRYWQDVQTTLDKVEIYFNELESGSGLGDSIQEYFDAWHELANTAPDNTAESTIKRQNLVEKSTTLTMKIKGGYNALESIRKDTDNQINEHVKEINDIAKNIALLNRKIAGIESADNNANDLRDQRENLLNDLAKIAGTYAFEKKNGQVTVYISGSPLVDGDIANKVFVRKNSENNGHYDLYWGPSDSLNGEINITNQISGGSLKAEIDVRDKIIKNYQDELNSLAEGLITETNKLHAVGQGLDRFTSLTSFFGPINPSYNLNSDAGKLPMQVNEGVFRISVYNSEGLKVHDYDIEVNPDDDSINSIITKINVSDDEVAKGKISASLSYDNKIKITVEEGYTFTFSEDTSGFLVAAGFNGFFKGTNASDIELSEMITEHPSFIATGRSGEPGDNTNALDIANVAFTKVYNSPSVTIGEFYNNFASEIGSDKYQADVFVKTREETVNQLTLRMESNRGVSEDEEFTNLIKFQSSYEASARVMTAVDEMLDKLINGTGVVGR
jgi:flagellar hook-associated protein 1 FlgK